MTSTLDDGRNLTVPRIGPRLLAARQRGAMTLAALARKSGVSQSMISQIERGQANPTFAVLIELTTALGIDLEDLTGWARDAEAVRRAEIIPAAGIPRIRNREDTCRMRILSPPQLAGELEWYRLDFPGEGALESQPHARGTLEHLTAISGSLIVYSGDASQTVGKGETVRYAADVPHRIENRSDHPVEAVLFVKFSDRTDDDLLSA